MLFRSASRTAWHRAGLWFLWLAATDRSALRARCLGPGSDRRGAGSGYRRTGGVVVALEQEWRADSTLRGGKYLWVYDPGNRLLVYYAHNQELLVNLGTIVRPGELLARVGRSGLNAARKRSPTHLHFSVLQLVNNLPVARNVYTELQHIRTVNTR